MLRVLFTFIIVNNKRNVWVFVTVQTGNRFSVEFLLIDAFFGIIMYARYESKHVSYRTKVAHLNSNKCMKSTMELSGYLNTSNNEAATKVL